MTEQIDRMVAVVSARLDRFERDMRQDGIRFGGLGIGSFEEMQAWVDINLKSNKYGCFVDGVSILQFMGLSYVTSAAELMTMDSVRKLGMVSGQEAKVITSFQNLLPAILVATITPGIHCLRWALQNFGMIRQRVMV